jgi:hypothetical protein
MIRVFYGGARAHPKRREQICRKDIYWAITIRPTDKWLSLRDLIVKELADGGGIMAIKKITLPGNERDKLKQRETNDTYQRRNILIYYCVFMIPISIVFRSRIY